MGIQDSVLQRIENLVIIDKSKVLVFYVGTKIRYLPGIINLLFHLKMLDQLTYILYNINNHFTYIMSLEG